MEWRLNMFHHEVNIGVNVFVDWKKKYNLKAGSYVLFSG